MKYISTRGGVEPVGFRESVMMGLARDGGLLLPETIPHVEDCLGKWRKLPYVDLAIEVMRLYVDLPPKHWEQIVRKSYTAFLHPEVTPLVPAGGVYVLELFHGPTLAFKDLALQLLGNLFEYILRESGRELNILAATSGDTGSAAIHGVRGRAGIRIFVMYPHGRVSAIQERQMTSVLDDNVSNIAMEGTFDDCQQVMKTLFNDLEFRDRYSLGAVNSINWARVLAQIVYYFYGAFRAMDATGAERVRFAVPTGNFGDIFAGYVAARMGLPVSRLVLATNENDILSRFFNTGDYSVRKVKSTISPSMDIQVASNFERYLYYRVGEDSSTLSSLMKSFAASGSLPPDVFPTTSESLMVAGAGNTDSTLATIREFYNVHRYLLDPHSAVGVFVGKQHLAAHEPMICLATAHPAKFGRAIREAIGTDVARHPVIDRLAGLPTRCTVLPASVDAVRHHIETHMGKPGAGKRA